MIKRNKRLLKTNTPYVYNGYMFNTVAKTIRYKELLQMQREKKISHLTLQKGFIIRPLKYSDLENGRRKIVKSARYYYIDFIFMKDNKWHFQSCINRIKPVYFEIKETLKRLYNIDLENVTHEE